METWLIVSTVLVLVLWAWLMLLAVWAMSVAADKSPLRKFAFSTIFIGTAATAVAVAGNFLA
jgi:hypothetical protein